MQSEGKAFAQYANFFRVGHSVDEFIIDFCQSYKEDEGEPKGEHTVARIIVTPEGARELHSLLGSSLEQQARLLGRAARDPER